VLIVENMTSEVVGIEIIDLVGRTLIHYPFSRKLEVDVSGLPKGIYLVRISGKSNRFTTKIVRN